VIRPCVETPPEAVTMPGNTGLPAIDSVGVFPPVEESGLVADTDVTAAPPEPPVPV
jgi:hypothetical protein